MSNNDKGPSGALHVTLWVVQVLLAAVFGMAGSAKLTTPIEALAAQMPWVSGAMGPYVKIIGTVEVLGALGLILPSATRIQPRLTPAAALGLIGVMLGAVVTHASRGEWPMLAVNGTLAALAAFVAWGRGLKAPIQAR